MTIQALFKQPLVVLDGAMSTPLEAMGVDTNNPLWTAAALRDQPGKVQMVHRNYLKAGAQLNITNTYQANVPAFVETGMTEGEAKDLIQRAVRLAQAARDDFQAATGKETYVAGSVGPYGAYLADGSEYRGDYDLTAAEYQAFHRPRIKELVTAGVDCLAIETQPKLAEVTAILRMLKTEFPQTFAYVSFSLHDPQTISEGTALADAVKAVSDFDQVLAVGVNCIPLEWVTPAIRTVKTDATKPIIVYPNSGAKYDPQTKTWANPDNGPGFAELVADWIAAGANIIGGCCTTMPKDIQAVADAVKEKR